MSERWLGSSAATLSVWLTGVVVLVAGCSRPGGDEAASSRLSEALEPVVEGIFAAAASTSLICLGEVHGSTADADLRSALIQHPDFPARFGLVLFEGASAAHQGAIDRLVLEDEELNREQLTAVWRDAGRGLQWRLPLYQRLFDELRELNRALPAGRRVRLLGGAAPIPWDAVRSPEELAPWLDREAWRLGQMRAALGGERAALAIYGRHHCERLRVSSDPALGGALVSVLSVGPAEDTELRRRFEVDGEHAVLAEIDELRGRLPVRDTWGEGHLVRGSRFEEVADAVVSYGRWPNSIRLMREESLAAEEREELRRRDRLRAEAIASGLSTRVESRSLGAPAQGEGSIGELR